MTVGELRQIITEVLHLEYAPTIVYGEQEADVTFADSKLELKFDDLKNLSERLGTTLIDICVEEEGFCPTCGGYSASLYIRGLEIVE